MKKYIVVFLFIFSLFFFTGCNRPQAVEIKNDYIMLSLQQNRNGQTKQSIIFSVNSDLLRKNSKNVAEEFAFKQNLIKRVKQLRNEFLFSFAFIYMQNPVEEFKINQAVTLSEVGYNQEGDYVGFEITFNSIPAWQYYHQSQKEEEKGKNNNIFLSKQVSQSAFPFCVPLGEGSTLGDKYKNCYLSAGGGLSIENTLQTSYNPQFIYSYSSFYSKFHTNADLSYKGKDKNHYHIWLEEDLKMADNIKIWTYTIYKGWWIAITLITTLSLMTISILILKRK